MACGVCAAPVRPGRRFCCRRCGMIALNRSAAQRAKASARMRETLTDPVKRKSLSAAITRGHLGHVPLDLRAVHRKARKRFGRREADRIIVDHLKAEKRRARL